MSVAAAVSDAGQSPSSALKWARKGFWAIADQGLFALSNMVIQIQLARTFGPREYGALTTALSLFLWVATAHTALVTEPMLVFGASYAKERARPYFRRLLALHSLGCVLGGAILAVTAAVVWQRGNASDAGVIAILAIMQALILFLWLARRVCYLYSSPEISCIGGAVYLCATVASIYLLSRTHLLTTTLALGLMGVCSLLVGIWLFARAYHRLPPSAAHLPLREVATEHWQYGRWALVTGVVGFLPANLYFFIVPLYYSQADNGLLKAACNFLLPAFQAQTSLQMLFLPLFATHMRRSSFPSLYRKLVVLAIVLHCGYWAVLAGGHHFWMESVCGKGFAGGSYLLIWLGAVPLVRSLSMMNSIRLRACRRPDLVSYCAITTGVFTLLTGFPLVKWYGLRGAVAGMVLGALVNYGIIWLLGRGVTAPSEPQPET